MYIVRETEQFQAWLDLLSDRRAKLRIVARLRRAEIGNLGDWKSIERGICEMRIEYGPGYRLYFTRRGKVLIIILCGGDKSTQQKDIRRAQRIVGQLESES